jgi:hypothetical protein
METINGAPIIDVFEPTYRTEPEEQDKFYPSVARDIAEKVVTSVLAVTEEEGYTYDDRDSNDMSLEISDSVREKVAVALKGSRYKVVVQTVIGQIADQGCRVASRCLWDPSTDNYAKYNYTNKAMFCSVLIFALYTD